MTKTELETLCLELASDLKRSGKPDVAEYFASRAKIIASSSSSIERIEAVSELRSSGAIQQYADFTNEQTAMFSRIHKASVDFLDRNPCR